VRMRYLPWMAGAAVALIGAPALAAGADPTSTAAVVTYDQGTEATAGFRDASQPDLADHSVAITTGGTVTFSFPEGAGTMPHNVKFDGALQPTSCVQTKFLSGQPQAPMPIPPLPSYVQNAGWEGNCTFGAVGEYSFVCSAHPTMKGTVVVTAAPVVTATPPPAATATASPAPTAPAGVVAAKTLPHPTNL
jgi:plastocyanin